MCLVVLDRRVHDHLKAMRGPRELQRRDPAAGEGVRPAGGIGPGATISSTREGAPNPSGLKTSMLIMRRQVARETTIEERQTTICERSATMSFRATFVDERQA